jgi:hypothetical protein
MIYILVGVFHAFHRLIESYHLDVIVLFFSLLEDALIEMGFPLEELTEFKNGRVRKIYSKNANGQNKEDESSLTTSGASTDDAEAILAALAGPLPYIRRGAWGKK